MGNCMHSYKKIYELPIVQPHIPVFEDFQIHGKELSKFYDLFMVFDSNRNGSIEVSEFLKHLDISKTPFSSRIFRVMDADSSGNVDFREFVLSIWNYCTLSTSTLELFAFDLYDVDSTGELSTEEVHRILQDVYGNELQHNQHARSISHALERMSEHELFSVERFRGFIKEHPNFFFPAIFLQNILQTEILGMKYWEKAKTVRKELSHGKEYKNWKDLVREVEGATHVVQGKTIQTVHYATKTSSHSSDSRTPPTTNSAASTHQFRQKRVSSSVSTSQTKTPVPPPPAESPSVPSHSILRGTSATGGRKTAGGSSSSQLPIVQEAFHQLVHDASSVGELNRKYRSEQHLHPATSPSTDTGGGVTSNNSRNSSQNSMVSPRDMISPRPGSVGGSRRMKSSTSTVMVSPRDRDRESSVSHLAAPAASSTSYRTNKSVHSHKIHPI